MWAKEKNFPLTHWIAFDRALRFGYDVKFYPFKGKTTFWFHTTFWSHPISQTIQRQGNIIKFYEVVPEKPVFQCCLRGGPEDICAATLDNWVFSTHTAISLAVALGFDDIRLRGNSFDGGYWNSAQGKDPERDNYWDAIQNKFDKIVLPACEKKGVRIKNETPGATFLS